MLRPAPAELLNILPLDGESQVWVKISGHSSHDQESSVLHVLFSDEKYQKSPGKKLKSARGS